MEAMNKAKQNIGSYFSGRSSEKARSVNAYTNEVMQEYDYLNEDQINQKIEESWNSFQKYKMTPVSERAERLRKLADIMEKDIERLAKMITMEMGKPIRESRSEVRSNIKECRYLAENAEKLTAPEECTTDAKKCYVTYDPMGVIYHITPFSFPFRLLFRGTLSALLMGNTVVNKSSPCCPQIGIMSEELFRQAGWKNSEFLNLIVHSSQSEILLKSPWVRLVSFTGSSDVGRKIAELAGRYCKKSILELGGSDPFIVLKDADLDKAVEKGIEGRLLNAGQVGTGPKRFIIDGTVYDDFKQRLLERLSKVKMGDPMDENTTFGPLADKKRLNDLMEQVERGKKSGAKLLYGGERPKDPTLSKSNFYMPTVIEVTKENPLFKEETFGPIFALTKFKDEKEAIRLANNTRYGLGSFIFSKDEERAQKLAREIEAGVVYINHYSDCHVRMPEGGVKDSGFGRDCGVHGAHEFASLKTVYISN